MQKRGGLKRLFNKFAAATVLSAGILSGAASAQAVATPPAPTAPTTTVGCPAFPDFQRPDGPMHRMPRDHTVDLQLKTDQISLKTIGITPGATDGLGGGSTRAAIREFLLFYAPIYQGDANKYVLAAADSAQLKKYAGAAVTDAKTYKTSAAQAAAYKLASARTGIAMATLAKKGVHKFDSQTWLYMVKTYGASYGMDFYAHHIVTDQQGRLAADNPFIHRQLLDLESQPRLAALMTAEYLKHKDTIPAPAKTAFAAPDPGVKAQQKDLMALGFNIGKAADGIKGELTLISMQEFQMLYGAGAPTGNLRPDEIQKLSAAAKQAAIDGKAYNAPTLAAGPIRMASDQSGADFGYMMNLAEAESSFVHTAKASTSSATGLYQFIEGTWSYMVLDYGAKHGLGSFANQVETYKDDLGREQARIPNPLVRQALLDMRATPQLAALFSADFQDENKAKEACYVDGQLTRTDLYLAHFLGPADAVWFINQMQKDPGQSAPNIFPEESEYNESVFYDTKHAPERDRSLQDVYNNFQRKIDPDAGSQAISPVPAPKKPAPPA